MEAKSASCGCDCFHCVHLHEHHKGKNGCEGD